MSTTPIADELHRAISASDDPLLREVWFRQRAFWKDLEHTMNAERTMRSCGAFEPVGREGRA